MKTISHTLLAKASPASQTARESSGGSSDRVTGHVSWLTSLQKAIHSARHKKRHATSPNALGHPGQGQVHSGQTHPNETTSLAGEANAISGIGSVKAAKGGQTGRGGNASGVTGIDATGSGVKKPHHGAQSLTRAQAESNIHQQLWEAASKANKTNNTRAGSAEAKAAQSLHSQVHKRFVKGAARPHSVDPHPNDVQATGAIQSISSNQLIIHAEDRSTHLAATHQANESDQTLITKGKTPSQTLDDMRSQTASSNGDAGTAVHLVQASHSQPIQLSQGGVHTQPPGFVQSGLMNPAMHTATATAAQAQSNTGEHSVPSLSGQSMQAMQAQIQTLHQNGGGQARIQLNPPSLGQVQIHVQLQANNQAQVSMTAALPSTAQALQSTLPQLNHALQQSGIHLTHSEVNTNGSNTAAPGQQGHTQQQGQHKQGEAWREQHSARVSNPDHGLQQGDQTTTHDNGVMAYA